jgi:site-specific DNA recombinase
MSMKTKNESKDSHAKLSEPWRNIKKGELVEIKRPSPEERKFRIAGYVRLSPTGDDREEGSLISHPQRIRQFVESKNLQTRGAFGEIVDWYVDKDLSGKDMNRPAFQKMLADIKAGVINAVVVTELSRLNRKVKDFLEVYEFFKAHNVAFFCLRENFDTSTAIGELMLIQAMSFAQYERQTIVDRIKRGARARAERGLANGYIPLGFKAVEHRPNYREIDETEKPYVEMIFKKFLELKRINRLVKYLNDNGYTTKKFVAKSGKAVGGNRWTLSSIHSLLTNRTYIGEREVNKKFRTIDPENLKDDERYFFVEAHWPALISKELFFDVQRLLEENKKKARKYTHEYLLTGVVECAECGAKLVGKSGKGTGGKYFYYGHMRKMVVGNDRHLHRCRIENVPALMLEEALVARLKDLSSDRELMKALVDATNSGKKETVEHHKSLVATEEQKRRKCEQKLKNLIEAMADETDRNLRAGISERAKAAQVELDRAEATLLEAKRNQNLAGNVVDVSTAMEVVRVFREGAFDALPVSAKAEILKSRIRRIIVRDSVVCVEIYGGRIEPLMELTGAENTNPRPGTPDSLGSTRSGVRTVFKLVGVAPM